MSHSYYTIHKVFPYIGNIYIKPHITHISFLTKPDIHIKVVENNLFWGLMVHQYSN